MPLPSVVWSEVLRRPVDPAHLFAIVMSDAAAAFLVHGLAALDDETLQFFVDHPAAVRQLYERGAPAFATFAAHLQVRANRVVVPGGDQAVPLWEALIGEQGRPAGPLHFPAVHQGRGTPRVSLRHDRLPRSRAGVVRAWPVDRGRSSEGQSFQSTWVSCHRDGRHCVDRSVTVQTRAARSRVDAPARPASVDWCPALLQRGGRCGRARSPPPMRPAIWLRGVRRTLTGNRSTLRGWPRRCCRATHPRARSVSISLPLASVRWRRPARRTCPMRFSCCGPFPAFAC